MAADGLEGRLAALETTVNRLAAEVAELSAAVRGGAAAGSPEIDLRAEDARMAVAAEAETAMVPEAALVGAAGGGDPLQSFLDAFVHAKGQRLSARQTADLASTAGVDAGTLYQGAHPMLRIDGSDRVLTLHGHKLYLQARRQSA